MSNVTRFEAGVPSEWKNFSYTHPAWGRPVRGKLFLGDLLDLRSMEISLNSLPAGVSMPFAHRHLRHEEVYVFVSGKGEFRVDEEQFEVGPGSVVRVSTAGVRAWRNVGVEPLVYLVIQATPPAEPARSIDDGVVEPLVPWA